MAVDCGADLVLELPVFFAVNGAPGFAEGAVRILKGIGAQYLAFGSETGDIAALQKTAKDRLQESCLFRQALLKAMDEGLSYPAAYDAALGNTQGRSLGSNDVLAVEYLKQNLLQKAGMKACCVERIGADHGSEQVSATYASASYIRSLECPDDAEAFMPAESYAIFQTEKKIGKREQENWFLLTRSNLLTMETETLAGFAYVTGGAEYRLQEAVRKAENLNGLIKAAKSKHYTYGSLARMIAAINLGITKGALAEASENEICYGRVLAFNEKGSKLLHAQRKDSPMPLITNINKNTPEDGLVRTMLAADVHAADIYNLIMDADLYKSSDYVVTPYRKGNTE